MTETTEEMEACPNPWCESHERPERGYFPFVVGSRASNEFAVSCPVCPMRGPWADTPAEAIAAWNRRPTVPDLTEAEEAELVERINGDPYLRPTVPEGLVERIAQFVADWNGMTRRGDTFLIADAIREKFATLSPSSHDSRLADELERQWADRAVLWTGFDGVECGYIRIGREQFDRILTALRSTPAPDALREPEIELGKAIAFEEAARLIERRNPNEGGGLDAMAIRALRTEGKPS